MSRYPRWFLIAAVFHLVTGAIFGSLIPLSDSGNTTIRFMHIHFLFLGFTVMLASGLTYEFLPRAHTGSSTMRWPGLVPAHFYLGNVGLVCKCVAFILRGRIGIWPFVLCALLVVTSLVFFAVNLLATLHPMRAPHLGVPRGHLLPGSDVSARA